MPLYSFIKIADNNTPSDFMIDVTSMVNWRSRMSAVRTQCVRHLDYEIGRDREIYKYFFLEYSFCCLEKGEFPDLATARIYRDRLHEEVSERRLQMIAKKELKDISRYNI